VSTYIVDTHALVWYLARDKKLSKRAEKILDDPHTTLIIPTIVLAETKYLFRKRKINIPFRLILSAIEQDQRCQIYPFDLASIEKLDESLNLHDAMIVAAGLVFKESVDPSTAILTKDRDIREAGLIETIW
jgi:PIN domain nuclease of toxin-antitoxin system